MSTPLIETSSKAVIEASKCVFKVAKAVQWDLIHSSVLIKAHKLPSSTAAAEVLLARSRTPRRSSPLFVVLCAFLLVSQYLVRCSYLLEFLARVAAGILILRETTRCV